MEKKTLIEGIKTGTKMFGKKAAILGGGVLVVVGVLATYKMLKQAGSFEKELTILNAVDGVFEADGTQII